MAAILPTSCGLCKQSVSPASLQSSSACSMSGLKSVRSVRPHLNKRFPKLATICAAKKEEEEPPKESLFTSITNALDFTAVRSEEDRQLIEDARKMTNAGEKMSREQYAALRRKVGGTYKSYFKEWIDVEGDYVESGWVDKTCKYCKKDTSNAPRQKDGGGRYAHVACAEDAKTRGNFFTRLFSG